jgi:hypothetical protein
MVMLIKFDSVFTLTSTIRLVMINVLLISMWEIVQALWDVYSTHPLDLSRFDTEPNQCLLEGIRSTDPRVQVSSINRFYHMTCSSLFFGIFNLTSFIYRITRSESLPIYRGAILRADPRFSRISEHLLGCWIWSLKSVWTSSTPLEQRSNLEDNRFRRVSLFPRQETINWVYPERFTILY